MSNVINCTRMTMATESRNWLVTLQIRTRQWHRPVEWQTNTKPGKFWYETKIFGQQEIKVSGIKWSLISLRNSVNVVSVSFISSPISFIYDLTLLVSVPGSVLFGTLYKLIHNLAKASAEGIKKREFSGTSKLFHPWISDVDNFFFNIEFTDIPVTNNTIAMFMCWQACRNTYSMFTYSIHSWGRWTQYLISISAWS